VATKVDISNQYMECRGFWGVNSLPPLDKIKVTLEPQMTSALGRAFPPVFKRPNGKIVRRNYFSITISKPWLDALIETAGRALAFEELRDTVIHELAHIACFFRWPDERTGHGDKWQTYMKVAGLKPRARCAYSDAEPVQRSDITWGQVYAAKVRLAKEQGLQRK
jgi:hypothetical protein